ncbi:MAG TPA: DinB family protein [Edaphobacter sp.]|jgi:uncharacterized damage-inducible protein DinB|nr:DinB family protein [Edaphobacter sp.]
MNELAQALIAESYAAPPSHILEGLADDLAHRELPNVPHTIYAELWHLAFWQQITLDWIAGIETPYPTKPSDGFPQKLHTEPWEQLRHRFLHGAEQAAAAAQDTLRLDHSIRCPSRPGAPTRIMSVRDQLISLAAHDAYHLGRIVLLRQFLRAWPPPSGGFTW